MIKAEVHAYGKEFVFGLPGFKDKHKAHAFMLEVVNGREFLEDEAQLVDFNNGYDLLRVYDEEAMKKAAAAEKQGVEVEPPKPEEKPQDPNNYVKKFDDKITYLGQPLAINGVKAMDEGVPFILVYGVDGQASTAKMSAETLYKLSIYVAEVQGYHAAQVIRPHGEIPGDDAVEYVQDYIEELKEKRLEVLTNQDKDATAYMPWNQSLKGSDDE